MRVRELIALLQTLLPDAAVAINGQEYHLTGTYQMLTWHLAPGHAIAVSFDVGLGFPGWFQARLDDALGMGAGPSGPYRPHTITRGD